jgi:hypothetical protein
MFPALSASSPAGTLAALVNLNHPASYLHSGWFEMSVPNVIVIGLMLFIFAAAIVLPFPGSRRKQGDS